VVAEKQEETMKVKITEVHEKELSEQELLEATLAYIALEYKDEYSTRVYEENGNLVCWTNGHGSGYTDIIRPITERDKAFLLVQKLLKEQKRKPTRHPHD
jgi:hypothetical protein